MTSSARTGPVHPGTQSGWTLVECLVALAVAGVVLASAGSFVRGISTAYQRSAAQRQVVSEIRRMQAMAVTRGGIFVFQWGGDPLAGQPTSQYRLVRDTTGACSIPAVGAATDGTNVIQGWSDLGKVYPGVVIQSIRDSTSTTVGKIMFNSMSASVNTCASVSFPVTVTIADASGKTKTILIQSAGGATPQ